MQSKICNIDVKNFISADLMESFPNVFPQSSSSGLAGYISTAREFGLSVEKKDRHHYFYLGDKEVGHTVGLTPSIVSRSASRTCADKIKTLTKVEKAGVQKSHIVFSTATEDFEEFHTLWRFYDEPFHIVVKPSLGRGGEGITVGVASESGLRAAWEKARASCVSGGQVIVEKQLVGLDVRITVVGGRAVCSTLRLPPYLVGDGRHSIKDLVAIKNKLRSIHPHHKRYPIPDSVLESVDKMWVPYPKQIVLLADTANIHQGGEAVDFTARVSRESEKLAEDAAGAIEGLGCAGVDLIVNNNGASVLEINVAANFGIIQYPMYGEPHNPAREVLREMMRRHSGQARDGH